MRRILTPILYLLIALGYGAPAWAVIGSTTTATESTVGSAVSTRTFNVTVSAAADRLLVCGTGARGNSAANLVTLTFTFNAVALTKEREDITADVGGGEFAGTSLWRLVAPSTGTLSAVVTFTGSVSNVVTAWCLPLNGVDQTTPIGAKNGATSATATTPITVSVTPTTDQSWVIDSVYSGNDTSNTIGGGQTARSNRVVTGGSTDQASASTEGPISPAASTVMSWTPDVASFWATSTMTINAASTVTPPSAGEGPSFTGTCNTLSWIPNTDVDLAGYRLYDRVSLADLPTLKVEVGKQITSVACAPLGFNPGQHYASLSSFDTSANESLRGADVPFVIVPAITVNDLHVTVVNANDVTLSFTEVAAQDGNPASYDIRYATPTITWGSAVSVTSGTCSTPVSGTAIGATKTCTVPGLAGTTAYQFQLVPFYGTYGVNAVFSPLSNITGATTGGSVPTSTDRVILATDAFTRATVALGSPWMSGYVGVGAQQSGAIVSNAVQQPVASGYSVMEIYNVTTPANQWGTVTLTATQGAGTVGHTIRLRYADSPTVSGVDCYAFRNVPGEIATIAKRTNGAYEVKATTASGSWSNGEQLDCEVQDQTYKLRKIVGGTPTVLLTWVDPDSTYTAGKVGFGVSTTIAGDAIVDDFTMGGFATVAPPVTDPCGCDNH